MFAEAGMHFDQVVATVLSILLAATACGTNMWAALVAPHEFRPLRAAIAILSSLYVVAYSWLLLTDITRTEWSEAMFYVSLAVWPIVWITPAVMAALYGLQIRRAVRRVADYE